MVVRMSFDDFNGGKNNKISFASKKGRDAKRKSIHSHIIIWKLYVFILIAVIVLLVKPTLVGISAKRSFEAYGMDPIRVSNELDTLKKTISGLRTNNSDLSLELTGLSRNVESQREEYLKLKKLFDDCMDSSQLTFIENENLRRNLSALKRDYEALANSSANNICCKMRYDFPEIDSFVIENNKIKCATGAKNKIKC